jgi:hydroxysqualene dehydroxylase
MGHALPPWQIVKERRATFAALPLENAKRPASQTRWHNLFLAGDWTATGLPATIEGAVRSGNSAAHFVKTAAQARSLNGSGRGMPS